MDRKEYFKQVVQLYEAAAAEMAGGPEVVPQQNIADSGMDVNPQVQGDPSMQQADPNMMQDPSAMGVDPMMGTELAATPSGSFELQKRKTAKLFNLFKDLLNYGTNFIEALNFIDIDLLDLNKFTLVKKYYKHIKELNDKIETYLQYIFNSESYEKEVYTYVLYRTELITNIKGIRDILDLQNPDEKLDQEK